MDLNMLWTVGLALVTAIVAILGINTFQKCCNTAEQKQHANVNNVILGIILALALLTVVVSLVLMFTKKPVQLQINPIV